MSTPTQQNKTPSPTRSSDTAAARVTLSTLTKPDRPLSYESDSEDSLHLGATDRSIRDSEDDLNYVPGGRRTDPTMVAARSKKLARDPSGGGDGGPPPPPPPPPPPGEQNSVGSLNWWWKLLLASLLLLAPVTLLSMDNDTSDNTKESFAISSKSELLHYIDTNMKNVPQNFPQYNNMAVYNVRPVITTPTISKQQQLIGKALPKLSTEPLQLISQSSASSKTIITSIPDWQPPLPAGILRLRMRRSLPGVHRTLSRFLSDDEIAEIQHYINVNNLSANDILRMFRGVEYTLFQVMDLLVAGNRNRVDVLMEPYFQEMYFNAGLTGKQALRMYTSLPPLVRHSYSLQRSGGFVSTQLAGYHGAEENDIMDGTAIDEDEGESDSDTQESDNEDEENDVHGSDSNTNEDDGSDEEDYSNEDGDDSEDDDDDAFDSEEDEDSPEPQESDEEGSDVDEDTDSEDEKDIDPEKDFDLHEPDDVAAAVEEETILETLDTGSSEEVEALFKQGQEHPEEVNHPNSNIYDIPKSSPEECKELIKERIHDINDAPQDLEEKKYDPICHRLLRGQQGCYSWLTKVPTRKSYKYKTTGEKKKAFPTPISCNLNIRDKSDTGPERQLLFIFLRFMPDNLRNSFEAIPGGRVYVNNNGKNRHPAEAMVTSEDRMVASSCEILRSGFGTPFWMKNVVMIETNPVSFPYGGKLSNVYGPKWIGEVRRRYTEVVKMAVEEAKNSDGRVKILLASSGVRDEFIDMMGGKAKFDNLRKDYPDLFVNVADDPVKDFKTMTHPETFTNKKIISKHGNSFPSRTKTLSKVVTQGLQHITQKKSIESDIGDQILNEIKNSPGYMAVVAAMKALHERNRERYRKGEGGLQIWAAEKLKELGWEGVDNKEAISVLYHLGEGSLQLWAIGECKRLGLGDVDPLEALSILMKHKFMKSESSLHKYWQKMCKEKRYRNADGSEPSAEEAKRVYEENEAFNKHWPKIQQYARYENNYETLEDGETVFVVPRRSETYDYLSNLRRANDDDWRLKKLRDAGINMDKYEEAQEKKKQDFAQQFDEGAKKAKSDNGFADDEDSDEDL